MTSEVKSALNDSNVAIQIAIGDPAPKLVPQNPGSGIVKDGVHYAETKRYVLKKAHLAMDDIRIFDTEGNLVANSHHPGKNPYDALDPLGLANTEAAFNVAGGEWSSICDVTAHSGDMRSFKVRPKTMTRHGRQFVKTEDDTVIMNVAKISKLKSRSVRSSYEVCSTDSGDRVYRIVTDLVGRTFQFYDGDDNLIAVMAKTKKALIMTAAFGSGSESTIDVAAGVDCSAVLAAIFGVLQVGSSVVGDAISNFFVDPAKDAAVDGAMDQVMGGDDEGGDDEGGGFGGFVSDLIGSAFGEEE